MRTLIRADSSSTIGLGHIMRDLVLAQELVHEGEVFFACQPLEGNIIERIPYPVHRLPSNDIEALISLIKTLHVTFLVIDHYAIHKADEQQIKRATNVKILAFDDTYEQHDCDILLNPNLCAEASRYVGLVPDHCEIRCGTPLIRDEFKKEKKCKRLKIYDVLIAMGGTDVRNITMHILDQLPPNIRICVVTTSSNAHLKMLQAYIQTKSNISLHVNSDEIAKLLNESRFAIVSPSVIVHEVLFMNIPFLAIKVAQNQDDMYQYLRRKGYSTMEHFDENSHIDIP